MPHSAPNSLHDRRDRTNEVLAEFRTKPFAWKGRANCIHLARAQLVAFGHNPRPVPVFGTPLGANKALVKLGFASMAELMDSMLPRIPPAMMWVGDMALLPGRPLDALAIHAGGGDLLGWHEDRSDGMVSISQSAVQIIAAWRL